MIGTWEIELYMIKSMLPLEEIQLLFCKNKMLLVTDNSGVAFEPSEKMDNFVDIQMLFSGLKKSLMHGFGPKP